MCACPAGNPWLILCLAGKRSSRGRQSINYGRFIGKQGLACVCVCVGGGTGNVFFHVPWGYPLVRWGGREPNVSPEQRRLLLETVYFGMVLCLNGCMFFFFSLSFDLDFGLSRTNVCLFCLSFRKPISRGMPSIMRCCSRTSDCISFMAYLCVLPYRESIFYNPFKLKVTCRQYFTLVHLT